ncbi:S-methyl-5'-thioadenosine phosphorylase-like [Euwallacea fornicatus]|uniref:S-methyl-5'-thioadenosine phosphorylase-like n=1 Tax=Euwallacea fornicatus TaxID=995702 RepID=UPI00338F7E09
MCEMSKKIKIGIIGGSGLDNPDILKNRTTKSVTTPFGEPSDVLINGEIATVPCVLLARHGRKHDKMPGAVNYRANIWALKDEGCTHIIATNACGSLQEHIPPGTIVVADGWIDRTTNRKQTFYDGKPGHPPGVCHMPMEPAFHPMLRRIILQTANKIGLKVKDGGCIVAIEGPRYSSKAESLIYQNWGADLVGMTTVPEVVLAKEAGLIYAVIAMATDWDCWRSSEEVVSHNAVLKVFQENIEKVVKLLMALIPELANEDWEETINEMENLARDSVISFK